MSSDVYRQHLEERLRHCHVPDHLHSGLLEYLTARHPPGGFLSAVLANNLTAAFSHADPQSERGLRDLVLFLYRYAPAESWGSVETVSRWLTDPDPVLESFE